MDCVKMKKFADNNLECGKKEGKLFDGWVQHYPKCLYFV